MAAAELVLQPPAAAPPSLLIPQEPDDQGQSELLQQGQQQLPDAPPREQALYSCFKRLDIDNSGFIETHELRAVAKQLSPHRNLEDALDMLKFVDRDKDRRVSWEEFRHVMLALTEPLSEEQFTQHVGVLLGPQPHNAFNEPGYCHPQGSRVWLQQRVVPVLREGLLALCDELVGQQLALAAGTHWQEGPTREEGGQPGTMYLPYGWLPFSPLKWLGEWLLRQLPPGSPMSPGPHGGLLLPSFSSMTRAEKIALAFKHLDRDNSGYLDSHELLVVAGKLHKDQDMQYAQELLRDMDLDQNGQVELEEYCTFVMSLTEVLTDDEFDAAIHKVLGASHYSYCSTRADKLAFLFHEVDQERTGVLSYDQVVHLAHCLDPSATPWKIQAALECCERHITTPGAAPTAPAATDAAAGAAGAAAAAVPGEQQLQQQQHEQQQQPPGVGVRVDEFVADMLRLLAHYNDVELDQQIVTLAEGRKLGAAVHASDPLDEVEPQRYKELLAAMTLPDHVLQIGTMEVIDWVDGGGRVPLLLVDVRGEEEVAVSCLPGALHVPAQEDTSAPLGWVLGDLEPLRRRLAAQLTQASRLPRLVAYCSTGQRSAPASVLLSKTLGVAVRSLCGGIINYYNQGGRVRDPQGAEVQAIHPGSPDLKPFVTRPSSFKFPGATPGPAP